MKKFINLNQLSFTMIEPDYLFYSLPRKAFGGRKDYFTATRKVVLPARHLTKSVLLKPKDLT